MNPALDFFHFETSDSGPIWIRRSAILSIEYRHDTTIFPPKIIPNSCVLHLDHDRGNSYENHVWITESPEDVLTRLRTNIFIRTTTCTTCKNPGATILQPICQDCRVKQITQKVSQEETTK